MNEEIQSAELITPSVMESQSRAEYDVAITTAKRFPRVISHFLQRAESLATATPQIAAAMEYARPIGGDKVKGPSARLAEIAAATYGNIRVQARIISETQTEVVAQGVAHDLETNVAQSTEVAVSILKSDGKTRYKPDQVATMRAAACAKARRNATLLIIPRALLEPIIAKCRMVAAGDQKTLPERRKALLDWFEKNGTKRAAIFEWLEVKTEDDIDLEKMADLIAAQNSAKEEGISVAEMFAKEVKSRFAKDEAATTTSTTTQQAPTQTNQQPVPTVTHDQCVALAKTMDDAKVMSVMETFEVHTISSVKASDLVSFHAALTAASTGKKP